MEVMPSGRVMLSMEEQPENALLAIDVPPVITTVLSVAGTPLAPNRLLILVRTDAVALFSI